MSPDAHPDAVREVISGQVLELQDRRTDSREDGTDNSVAAVATQQVTDPQTDAQDGSPGAVEGEATQSWKQPRQNAFRVLAVYWSFFVFGLNDGAYGALLPFFEAYYHIAYLRVSSIFLSPLLGYTLAALLNSAVHARSGQRGIAVLAGCCHIATYTVISVHPPYPVIIVMYAIGGFGYGLIDGAWNAWTGSMKEANAIQGLLSASYSLGATISPIMATSMSKKQGWNWYSFYWLMTGCAALSLVLLAFAFWNKDGEAYRSELSARMPDQSSSVKEALKNKITWLGAAYFFIYFGCQVALAGWIVSSMLKARHASRHESAISATGFQAGQTVGRIALGLATSRMTATQLWYRLIMGVFLACAVGLQLVFWLIPRFLVSAVAVAFLGFFLGPLFPAGVVMVLKLLPKHLHVTSIGLATALGGTGGALFPFAVGAIAQAKGVKSLQPVILALLFGILGLWLGFPWKPKRTSRNSLGYAVTRS